MHFVVRKGLESGDILLSTHDHVNFDRRNDLATTHVHLLRLEFISSCSICFFAAVSVIPFFLTQGAQPSVDGFNASLYQWRYAVCLGLYHD
jgi:hypothetical protein